MIEGLKDKVVIVTGGGHGIGKAYCLAFGRAGAKVLAADIDGPAAERVAVQVVKETRTDALGLRVDVHEDRILEGYGAGTGLLGRLEGSGVV